MTESKVPEAEDLPRTDHITTYRLRNAERTKIAIFEIFEIQGFEKM